MSPGSNGCCRCDDVFGGDTCLPGAPCLSVDLTGGRRYGPDSTCTKSAATHMVFSTAYGKVARCGVGLHALLRWHAEDPVRRTLRWYCFEPLSRRRSKICGICAAEIEQNLFEREQDQLDLSNTCSLQFICRESSNGDLIVAQRRCIVLELSIQLILSSVWGNTCSSVSVWEVADCARMAFLTAHGNVISQRGGGLDALVGLWHDASELLKVHIFDVQAVGSSRVDRWY